MLENLNFESMFQPEIVLIFLFAGIIKGLIGLGVPMITLSLMSLFQPIPSAVVITLLPSFLTNIWQMAKGGNFIKLSRKLWGLIVMVPPGVWLGTYFLDKFDLPWFSVILGSLLLIFGIISLAMTVWVSLRLSSGLSQLKRNIYLLLKEKLTMSRKRFLPP